MGNNIILLGLGIQIVFFVFFIIVTIVFHLRIARRPTTKSLATVAPWKKLLWVLYLTSLLILVRSLFRMIEYGQGNDGDLLKKEMYVYVLDATLMFIVAAVFTVHHPSEVLETYTALDESVGATTVMDSYPMVKGAGRSGL